ncbi:TetR/AcrR family transcriptional regulator [Quadrisphaera granulorum]|uniref:TetR/AcrR family transcriptional regulator n=1 Tax=Quadrisphaera granulorum TaxID=317664 RepID=UPI000D6B94A9|nr:TetR/AcrR family transcriptional regulator [Quadrisphaera granulorum]
MPRQDQRPRRRLSPDQRRDQLLAAAADVFAQFGFRDASVGVVAERARASEALVYRYFGSKDGLYLEVLRLTLDDLDARVVSAVAAAGDGATPRACLEATVLAYLEHVATHPRAWALPLHSPGAEPPGAGALRREARAGYVARLSELLGVSGAAVPDAAATARQEFALWGYFGFLDAACLRWVDSGCPATEREQLVAAAVGALQGGLGEGIPVGLGG